MTSLLNPFNGCTPAAFWVYADHGGQISLEGLAPYMKGANGLTDVVALGKAGLWRMGTPRSRGGLEGDPLTCPNVVEAVAPADRVAGWALTNPLIDALSWTRRRSTTC